MRTRLAATGAVLALALTACASGGGAADAPQASEAEPVTIRLWLNGEDTPAAARAHLEQEFAAANPGDTLQIEQQEWEGLVERLTTALSSDTETPDVVEIGNTQAATFTSVGAFSDLTGHLDAWGGDDLLPGFVEGATVDGATYAVPYYAGSKVVYYRRSLLEAAGLPVPTTLEQFIDTAAALKAANPAPEFSGFWFPGQDWRNGVALVWANGGEIATAQGDSWSGSLSSPQAQAGLAQAQELFATSGAGRDANEQDPQVPFCAGQAAMVSAPGWLLSVLEDPETGCPDLVSDIGAFALPGLDGGVAPVLLGGSDIAVSAASQHQEEALSLVEIMLGEEYQTILGENGLTPARTSLAGLLGDDEFARAAIAAGAEAKLTPSAAGWAGVEGARTMEDLFVGLANGGDPAELAQQADSAIDAALARG